MTETTVQNNQEQSLKQRHGFRCLFAISICSCLMIIGCVHVPPQKQRLLSKPNMQFSDSGVFSYQDKLMTQIESGSASFTGGQSGDCGSCVGGGQ